MLVSVGKTMKKRSVQAHVKHIVKHIDVEHLGKVYSPNPEDFNNCLEK